jgi:3-oxoacyl-[acyl-carrier-protein] synthase-3
MVSVIITGTGSYIPEHIQSNEAFLTSVFYTDQQVAIHKTPFEIIDSLKNITGIEERRYAGEQLNTSDIAAMAAQHAIDDCRIDPETLDFIIVAHNFGNAAAGSFQTDMVPSVANRVKHLLHINNPSCASFDVIFGCPGWVQGLIIAQAFCMSGMAKKGLIIGAEILSRVFDPADRDSMIYADGAGACIVEAVASENTLPNGILAVAAKSYSMADVNYIYMDKGFSPTANDQDKYLKMKGRKVYEFAMQQVPLAMKECLEKAGVDIKALKKIFIHQANEKMDEGIVKRFYELYGIDTPPAFIMPLSINKLGNSSVATIPTLYDLVIKGLVADHHLEKDDIILFASVGAGMNINAVCYRY